MSFAIWSYANACPMRKSKSVPPQGTMAAVGVSNRLRNLVSLKILIFELSNLIGQCKAAVRFTGSRGQKITF